MIRSLNAVTPSRGSNCRPAPFPPPPPARPTLHLPTRPATVDALELAKHRPQLLKYALRELRDATTAEDVVQETLLAALQGAERFRGGAALRTWLTGILTHKIADHYRRGRREASLADGRDGATYDPLDGHPGEDVADADTDAGVGWGDPEAAFAQERFFEVLERGIARLPARTARVFHMREVLGMSTDEICQALAITPAHCAVLLYRARMALRDFLQREWFAEARASA